MLANKTAPSWRTLSVSKSTMFPPDYGNESERAPPPLRRALAALPRPSTNGRIHFVGGLHVVEL